MASSIIWENSDQTVILIDIPRSIEEAQGSAAHRHLLSSAPLSTPFPSQEPKSAKARARLEQKLTDVDRHTDYQTVIEAALKDIREHYVGLWCHSRPFIDESLPGQKRKLSQASGDDLQSEAEVGSQGLASMLEHPERILVDDSDHIYAFGDSLAISNHDSGSQIVKLRQSNHQGEPLYRFRIPPHASFFLGECGKAKNFRDTVRIEAKRAGIGPEFDFILLDPPWPNSSVKRTHKTPGSTYSTFESMEDLHDMLLDTKIDLLIGEECTVAVWITNKPASRKVVLDEDRGLFACWNVELAEEWLWVKTTTNGEPVFPVDALWRKPYEVLLIGRKRRKTDVAGLDNSSTAAIERRVLISVPDIHSRKPCLQRFLPLLLPDPHHRRTLEIFARHLVEGWWSWGNECIKFNWEDYWRGETESEYI